MLDESLRRRLEALNREPLRPVGADTLPTVLPAAGPINGRGAGPLHPVFFPHAARASASIAGPTTVRPVGNLLECGEVVETSAGPHFRISQPVEEIWKNGERLVAARHAILQQTSTANGHAVGPPSPENSFETCSYRSEARALVASFPDRALFLDLETCGLAGAALFLAGCLRRIDGRLTVELLFARTYAEEKAVLVSLWERVRAQDVLVTFNGKSFDWPMVQDRSTRYLLGRVAGAGPAGGERHFQDGPTRDGDRTSFPADTAGPTVHVDILHHARRRWRGRLPNCKLQTLERYICGRRREGDIPGVQIPAAYQRFVQTGDPREMESVLFHNALDLVTLLDLSIRLAGD